MVSKVLPKVVPDDGEDDRSHPRNECRGVGHHVPYSRDRFRIHIRSSFFIMQTNGGFFIILHSREAEAIKFLIFIFQDSEISRIFTVHGTVEKTKKLR